MPTMHRPTGPTGSSSLVRLYGVPAESVDLFWPEIAPLLQKALDRSDGRYAIEDIRQFIDSGDMHLWAVADTAIRAAIVTQTVIYPRRKVGLILLLGGCGMRHWLHLIEEMEACFKREGCACLELYGRPGWQKVLKDYKTPSVALRKEL